MAMAAPYWPETWRKILAFSISPLTLLSTSSRSSRVIFSSSKTEGGSALRVAVPREADLVGVGEVVGGGHGEEHVAVVPRVRVEEMVEEDHVLHCRAEVPVLDDEPPDLAVVHLHGALLREVQGEVLLVREGESLHVLRGQLVVQRDLADVVQQARTRSTPPAASGPCAA